MQVQIDIGLEQLIQVIKNLPAAQLSRLKAAIEDRSVQNTKTLDLEAFLMQAPTFSKKQLNTIAKTRKAINQWRTK